MRMVERSRGSQHWVHATYPAFPTHACKIHLIKIHSTNSKSSMESDRAETDVGKDVVVGMETEEEKPKQPRKRFIGRKAAAKNAEGRRHPDGVIEESSAVQCLSSCINSLKMFCRLL